MSDPVSRHSQPGRSHPRHVNYKGLDENRVLDAMVERNTPSAPIRPLLRPLEGTTPPASVADATNVKSGMKSPVLPPVPNEIAEEGQ